MECQKVTALTCIDLSAAFDTVDHQILMNVLQTKFGIEDTVWNWFFSYLQPRDFSGNIGDSYSSKMELTFSVPQGSCAGPTLYSVYASTTAEVVPQKMDIHGYADDHVIKISFRGGIKDEEELALSDMEKTLSDISEWMKTNRLKMNDSKTEFIIFGACQQLQKLSITSVHVNNTLIKSAEAVKYLGVYMDKNLNFKKQITEKCKVASMNLYRIKNIRQYLTLDACKVLVLGLVVVHLDYANSIYSGLPNKP